MADNIVGREGEQSQGVSAADLLGLAKGDSPSTEVLAGGTTAQAAAPDASQDAATTEAATQAAADKLKIDLDGNYELGGEALKGRDIVEGYMRRADYTKKTQEVAAQKSEFEKQTQEAETNKAWVGVMAKDPVLSIGVTALGRGKTAEEAYALMDAARGQNPTAAQAIADAPPINPATNRPYEEGDLEFENWKLQKELSKRDEKIDRLFQTVEGLQSTLATQQKETETQREAREQRERVLTLNATVIADSEKFIKNKLGEQFSLENMTEAQAREFGKRLNATALSRNIELYNDDWKSKNLISHNDMELIIDKTDFSFLSGASGGQQAKPQQVIANQSPNNRMSAGAPSAGSLAPATDVDVRPQSPTKQFDEMLATATVRK